jgi:hypothetical protein
MSSHFIKNQCYFIEAKYFFFSFITSLSIHASPGRYNQPLLIAIRDEGTNFFKANEEHANRAANLFQF